MNQQYWSTDQLQSHQIIELIPIHIEPKVKQYPVNTSESTNQNYPSNLILASQINAWPTA